MHSDRNGAQHAPVMGRGGSMRLRGGMVRAASLVAALSAATPMTAQAATIYTTANTTVTNGSSVNVNIGGVPAFSFFASLNGKSGKAYINNFDQNFDYSTVSPTFNYFLLNTPQGSLIRPATSVFSSNPIGYIVDSNVGGITVAGNSFYTGFRFLPATPGATVSYGWAQFALATTSLTLIDYAYDDTGAAIAAGQTVSAPTISADPEPTTWAMLLLGFAAIGGVFRYRRASRRVAFS